MIPVTLNDALLQQNSQQRFVPIRLPILLLLAASDNNLLNEDLEVLNILLVVGDEALVANNFYEVTECPHTVKYLFVAVLCRLLSLVATIYLRTGLSLFSCCFLA